MTRWFRTILPLLVFVAACEPDVTSVAPEVDGFSQIDPTTLAPVVDPSVRGLTMEEAVVAKAVTPASVGPALVFGDYYTRANVHSGLQSLGYAATLAATLPNDLSSYSAIFHMGAFAALTPAEKTRLLAFMDAGGGLHLTGERPCCEIMNDGHESLINDAVSGGGIALGGLGDFYGSPYPFNATARGGVTTTPHVLENWSPSAGGGMTGVSGDNVFVTHQATGVVMGAVWGPEDMQSGSGRLTVLMDVNWPGQSGWLELLDNLMTFHSSGAGPSNQSPTVATTIPPAALEGSEVTFAATGSDPDGDALIYTWDFGDGSPTASGATVVHTYEDNATFTATVTVDDGNGGTATGSGVVVVENVAPVVSLPGMAEVLTLDASTGTGSFVDPGADQWVATVDYGEAAGDEPLTLSAGSFALSHAYADDGVYTVTVTVVDDEGATGVATTTATILNRSPVADATGSDSVIECPEGGSAVAHLDASASSDADGSIVSWEWRDAAGTTVASGPSATVAGLAMGTQILTLVVTDDDGASASTTHAVTIEDTTPPEITFDLLVSEIWPANHKMVRVASGVRITDACDEAIVLSRANVSVTSNEPVDGPGDGNTEPDWNVIENGDGTVDIEVRAERSGQGNGRTYTITVSGSDASGNGAAVTRQVLVPKSQGKNSGE